MNDSDGVGEERCDGVQGFYGTFGAAGQIQDQRGLANGGYSTRKNGARRVGKALPAHLFGHPGN